MQSKVAANTTVTKDAELNKDLKKFWEYDSKITSNMTLKLLLTGSKAGLS